MADIIDLTEFTHHIHTTDPVTKNVHVLPVGLLRNLANGVTKFSEIEEMDETLRSIIYMLVDRINAEIDEAEG